MSKMTDRKRLVKILEEVKNVKLDDGWDGNTIIARIEGEDSSHMQGDVVFAFDNEGKLTGMNIAEKGPT